MTKNPPPKQTWIRDLAGLAIFAACVFVGTLLINTFVFRSFNVDGKSMEKTLHNGDRLIVNRLPVTAAQLQNKPYVPERGQIIVFKNPLFNAGTGDEYIVKRVIAFPGERVVLKDGVYTIYNTDNPHGFTPDTNITTITHPASGQVDTTIPQSSLFVSGDNRQGSHSLDSRNGLGYVPYHDIVGPVSLRIFPFTQIRSF